LSTTIPFFHRSAVKFAANSDKRRVFLASKQWLSILDTYAFSIGIRHNFDSLELE